MSFNWTTTNLPAPATDLESGLQSSVIRTPMDSGTPRQRQRFTAGIRPFSASWELDDDEWALFQGVYVYKLAMGADWFDMSLPFGDGFKTYNVRFTGDVLKGAYKDVMHWRVTATMETDNISPLSEAEVDAILAP
jgi:hypothetical protein